MWRMLPSVNHLSKYCWTPESGGYGQFCLLQYTTYRRVARINSADVSEEPAPIFWAEQAAPGTSMKQAAALFATRFFLPLFLVPKLNAAASYWFQQNRLHGVTSLRYESLRHYITAANALLFILHINQYSKS
jgi:hypothetical protein